MRTKEFSQGAGSGWEALEAMRRTLRGAGWPVVDAPRSDALTIRGKVELTKPEGGSQRVALHWLIPGEQLKQKRKEVGYDNAVELASIFKVPLQEMKIRMGQIRRRIRWSDV